MTKRQKEPQIMSETETKISAPEGFSRDTAVQDAPWSVFQENNIIHGRLLGCFTMQTTPPRDYYQIELFAPATVRVGKGNDSEVTTAQAGDVINLGITYQLQCWREKQIPEVEAGAEWHVWAKIGKKERRQNGHTFWQVDPRSKRAKAPTGPVVARVTAAQVGEDDEDGAKVPF
jgi:hypothetical protein